MSRLQSMEEINGLDFASTILSLSQGAILQSNNRKYSPLRKSIFEDRSVIPQLNYAHISHECDAQIKESETYWNKGGKKISDELRFPKQFKRVGDGNVQSGILFPEEIPKFDEREVVYYDKVNNTRKVIRTAPRRKFDKPLKPTQEEESSHLGPGCYSLSDPWVVSLQPVCGAIRPTSSFGKSYRNESRGSNQKNVPLSTEIRDQISRIASRESNSRGKVTSPPVDRRSSVLTHPTSTWGGIADRQNIERKRQIQKQSSIPGFSFTSQSFVVGAEDLGVKYQRIKDRNGYPIIIPVSRDESPLLLAPPGSTVGLSWATTGDIAEADPNLRVDVKLSRGSSLLSYETSSPGKDSASIVFQNIREVNKPVPDSLPGSQHPTGSFQLSPSFSHISYPLDVDHFKAPISVTTSAAQKKKKEKEMKEKLIQRTIGVISSAVHYRNRGVPVKLADIVNIVNNFTEQSSESES